jgi:hypothetical protein
MAGLRGKPAGEYLAVNALRTALSQSFHIDSSQDKSTFYDQKEFFNGCTGKRLSPPYT